MLLVGVVRMSGRVDLGGALLQLGESGIQVEGVVKGHVVHALHVRLQIPFLRGSVRAEVASERSLPCKGERQEEQGARD